MASISLTESDVLSALTSFLLGELAGIEVLQSHIYRTGTPDGDFVTITPVGVAALSMNEYSWSDPSGIDASGIEQMSRTTVWAIQLDFYGATAAAYASLIAGLVRSDYACSVFSNLNPAIQPLYAEAPTQTVTLDPDSQYGDRWTVVVHLQGDPIITTPQRFASAFSLSAREVDAKFPP